MTNESRISIMQKPIMLYGLKSTTGFELKVDFENFGKDYVDGAERVDQDVVNKGKQSPWVYVDFVENEISRMRGDKSRIVYIGKTTQPFYSRYYGFKKDYGEDVNKIFYTNRPFTRGCKYRVYLFDPHEMDAAYNVWGKGRSDGPFIEEWLESMLLGIYYNIHSELPPKNSTWKFRDKVLIFLNFIKTEKNWYGFDEKEPNPFESD